MRLKYIEIAGFKSFAKKATLSFDTPVTAVVGPNGSGKSNVVESFRFVLGEQSMKSMRGKSGSDLIFRGAAGAPKLSRATVTIAFDNSDKVFAFQLGSDHESKIPMLFDTVTFTREIFADGSSKYLLNGTEVRLKTLVELLASVNIGASGHHIISQGEADGILRAAPRDRREMLEDALGLKIYHYRIRESESKLAKTAATLKEVQSLRRELAPHLKFLQKQVEKIERGRAIREELRLASLHFLALERALLAEEDDRLSRAEALIRAKKTELEHALSALPPLEGDAPDESATERSELSARLRELHEKRRATESRMSRLEGMLEAHRTFSKRSDASVGIAVSFALTEYRQFIADLEYFLGALRRAETIDAARGALSLLEPLIARLKAREPVADARPGASAEDASEATMRELEGLQADLIALVKEETELSERLGALVGTRERSLAASRDATRAHYELKSELANADAELQILAVSKNAFLARKESFDAELKEAGFMFGPAFLHALYEAKPEPVGDAHEQKRPIDRLKIRLDEHAGIGSDVTEEYESAKARDEFLARELVDVEASVRNLEALIVDLKKVLDERFTKGVAVINERFGEFFKTMFGGGGAFLSVTLEKKRKSKLSLEEEHEDPERSEGEDERLFERGIDIHVNLPSKKVKELNMLSGGERSLVSIALLFAISQVNPPPFLVLDETDAALDEANSRRYGDMVERLSEYSQLIVVTHNRETMSRASVLYGVTLGADGASKLLSIKFDEAVKVAK